MHPSTQLAWARLHHEAVSQLREAASSPDGWRLTARILILPVLDDANAYDVLRSLREGNEFLTRRTTWKCKDDSARIADPATPLGDSIVTEPTFEYQQVRFGGNGNIIAKALDAVRGSAIPLMAPDRPFGVAGVSYEVMFGDLHSSCQYRWWVAPPRGWESLDAFVNLITLFVDRGLAEDDRTAGKERAKKISPKKH